MATSGSDLITALAQRLRDASSGAHSRDFLLRVLSHSQRAVNLAKRGRKASATLTVAPGRTLYETSAIAANVARIERVIHQQRPLPEVLWRQLINNNPQWYRDTDDSIRCWARIGGNLFVLYPTIWEVDTVTVIYTTVPADVIDDVDPVDLPDELLPTVMDLAEVIVLAKGRLFHAMEAPMGRLGATKEQ